MLPSAVVRVGERNEGGKGESASVGWKWEEGLERRGGGGIDDKERMKAPKQPYRILSVSRNGDGSGWVVAMPVFKGLE